MKAVPLAHFNGLLSQFLNSQDSPVRGETESLGLSPGENPAPAWSENDESVMELLTMRIKNSKMLAEDKSELLKYVNKSFRQLSPGKRPDFALNVAYLVKLKEINNSR